MTQSKFMINITYQMALQFITSLSPQKCITLGTDKNESTKDLREYDFLQEYIKIKTTPLSPNTGNYPKCSGIDVHFVVVILTTEDVYCIDGHTILETYPVYEKRQL